MNVVDKLYRLAIKAWNAYLNNTAIRDDDFVVFPITKGEIKYIFEKTGIDVSGYSRLISIREIKHVFDQHGDAKKESRRGQLPIVPEDIKSIPLLFSNAEIIDQGRTRQGLASITYRIDMGPSTIYIEEVRTGSKKLALKSMRKMKPK